jgi:CRP-like cAMP-binding protein
MSDALDRLRAVPLFADLDDDDLARIADHATEFEVPAGHVLVQPNREATGLFVIEEGTVAVEREGKSLDRGPGSVVGELAVLVPGATRSARVIARAPVRGAAISRDDFIEMLKEQPAIALALLRSLAERLAASTL